MAVNVSRSRPGLNGVLEPGHDQRVAIGAIDVDKSSQTPLHLESEALVEPDRGIVAVPYVELQPRQLQPSVGQIDQSPQERTAYTAPAKIRMGRDHVNLCTVAQAGPAGPRLELRVSGNRALDLRHQLHASGFVGNARRHIGVGVERQSLGSEIHVTGVQNFKNGIAVACTDVPNVGRLSAAGCVFIFQGWTSMLRPKPPRRSDLLARQHEPVKRFNPGSVRFDALVTLQ